MTLFSVCSTTEKVRRSFASEHFFSYWVQGYWEVKSDNLAPCRPSVAARADINKAVRHKSLICEYALFNYYENHT